MPEVSGFAEPKRIMVIIQGRLFRNGIESVLRAAAGHIIYGCETLDEAEMMLKSHSDIQPDLFVIGMDVPGRATEHLTRIRALRAERPEGRWIVLSNSCGGPEFWWQAVESRVDGVLHEDSPGEVLQLLVRLILLGYSFLPSSVAMMPGPPAPVAANEPSPQPIAPTQTLQELFKLPDRSAAMSSQPSTRMRSGLSERESEILRGLVAGQSNKAIARDLHISEATVKVHVKALLRKMQVTNRTQAAISALRFLNNPAQENTPVSSKSTSSAGGEVDQSNDRS